MNSSVRPELPTPAHHPASYGRSAGCRAGVDNSALFPTLPVSTYKSGIAVQTNRATSPSVHPEPTPDRLKSSNKGQSVC